MLETARKGDRVAAYFGETLTADEAKARDSDYIVKVNKNLYLDAKDVVEDNKGRYVNYGGPGYINNARLGSGTTTAVCKKSGRPWISIKATRTIKPGTEILMPYGKGWTWPWQQNRQHTARQHMQVPATIKTDNTTQQYAPSQHMQVSATIEADDTPTQHQANSICTAVQSAIMSMRVVHPACKRQC